MSALGPSDDPCGRDQDRQAVTPLRISERVLYCAFACATLAALFRAKTGDDPCHGPLPCVCESDIALAMSCQRDVPRSYFCSGSGDAVGRHPTQTFNFAVCSHRVPALDCARDVAKTREGMP